MNDIYYRVGKTFIYEGKKYVCKENKNEKLFTCKLCVLQTKDICTELNCINDTRKDGKDVYFDKTYD